MSGPVIRNSFRSFFLQIILFRTMKQKHALLAKFQKRIEISIFKTPMRRNKHVLDGKSFLWKRGGMGLHKVTRGGGRVNIDKTIVFIVFIE